MESAYQPQIDEIVAEESATPYISHYTAYPLNLIQQLTQAERAKYSVTDDMFPAFVRLAGGSQQKHFFQAVIVHVFELSLSLEDPLAFWIDLAWVIDSSPFFDKSDEIEGQELLHINDMIQRTQTASRGPMALGQRSPIQVFIGVFYNKMTYTSFAQTFVRLLLSFVQEVQLQHFPEARINDSEYKGSDQDCHRQYSGAGFSSVLSTSSSMGNQNMNRILASLFGLNLTVLSNHFSEDMQAIQREIFKKEYFSQDSVIMTLDQKQGWKLIYRANQKNLKDKLNQILNEQNEEEEVKRELSDELLLQRVDLDCGCCPSIRRSLFLSYVRKEIPGFGTEYSVAQYSRREKKLECRGEKPLEILTIMKVLNKNLNNEEYYQIAQTNEQNQARQYQNQPYQQPLLVAPPVQNEEHNNQNSRYCAKIISGLFSIIVGVIVFVIFKP